MLGSIIPSHSIKSVKVIDIFANFFCYFNSHKIVVNFKTLKLIP